MLNRSDEPALVTLPGPWGVPIEIAPSFLLLSFVFVGLSVSVHSLIFFGLVALAILLHELGHAWGALIQGLPVRRVVLWGGGGFCESGAGASSREQEFIVAMGPLTNLALWALASLAAPWPTEMFYEGASETFYYAGWYLDRFAWINLALFGLNLIPVQPLDGGRLLDLVLRRFLGWRRAARVAGAIGLVFAVAWIPAMAYSFLTWGWLLLFIPSIPLHWNMMRGSAVA